MHWGTTGADPPSQTADVIDEAARRGSTYAAPAFTADADHSALAPGEDVDRPRHRASPRVDLIVLLAEGRGGRFVRGGRRLACATSPRLGAAAAPRLAARGPVSVEGLVGDSGNLA